MWRTTAWTSDNVISVCYRPTLSRSAGRVSIDGSLMRWFEIHENINYTARWIAIRIHKFSHIYARFSKFCDNFSSAFSNSMLKTNNLPSISPSCYCTLQMSLSLTDLFSNYLKRNTASYAAMCIVVSASLVIWYNSELVAFVCTDWRQWK